MLLSLYIENIALIQKLNIEPGSGLTVLTGETGAGKTIIVGSLSLLCGARGDRDVVRTGEDHALAEGVFGNLSAKEAESLAALGVEPDDDGLVMLSRRISSDGRSVCRVNGRTVTAGMLKSVGACLLNLHGQQESMQLSDPDTHLPLLDGYAADGAELDSYKTRYRDWLAAKKRLESLENASRDSEERADMLDFQINELEAVSPRAGEYAELEAESLRLGNFEKIAEGTQRAHDALYANPSAYELIKKAESSLKRLSAVLPEAEELAKRLESCSLEIADIAETLTSFSSSDGENVSVKLDRVEGRLAELKRLERKYRVPADELAPKLASLKEERRGIESADELAAEAKKELDEKEKLLSAAAKELSDIRKAKANELSQTIMGQLEELDMPSVRFEPRFSAKPFAADGADDLEFLIAPNKGEEPKPMSKIASGGELSRIMLSVKSALAASGGAGCAVFDEIDTGISGKTSEKIGIKLKQLASHGSQVICVTHSAQIAALADTHLRVSKTQSEDRTYTQLTVLDNEGRINEVARIMGGISLTDSVLAAAREAIENGRNVGS